MTDTEQIRKSAYKKQDVKEMSLDELRVILLTCDGKGRAFKEKALEELLKRVKEG